MKKISYLATIKSKGFNIVGTFKLPLPPSVNKMLVPKKTKKNNKKNELQKILENRGYVINTENLKKDKKSSPFVKSKIWRKYQNDIALLIRSKNIKIKKEQNHNGTYALYLAFTFPDKRTRDINNMIKCLEDTVTKSLCFWKDDRQIKESIQELININSKNPHVIMVICNK